MKSKNIELIRAESNLPLSKLLHKLAQVTAEEFDKAKQSKKFHYYGKIQNNAFDIRNVKYSLYSAGPAIHGEAAENSANHTSLNFNIDIEDHNKYVNVILTAAILVIAISATLFSLGHQADKLLPLAVFGAMLVFALGYVLMIKLILNSTKKEELKKFLKITESKLV